MIHLRQQILDDIDQPGGLQRALQKAIELEHATLPTYLYSMYSLGDANPEVAAVILSVAMEEMLHFCISCNVLNAIGGSPAIDTPDFIPAFPGPLPGGVDAGLCVHLRRYSQQHVHDTFMAIEEPDDPLKFRALAAVPGQVTIGTFYARIAARIAELGDGIFVGDPARQVLGGFPPAELFPVRDVASAVKAIEIIRHQGEGTADSPLESPGNPKSSFAHYYRFAELFHGFQLQAVPNPPPGTPPDQLFRYDGPAIPFNPAQVLPVIDDPQANRYPVSTKAYFLNNNFNYAYTSLLKALHTVFNGQPQRLGAAIAVMHSLRELALEMMTTAPLDGGVFAGPSFEYRPVNS